MVNEMGRIATIRNTEVTTQSIASLHKWARSRGRGEELAIAITAIIDKLESTSGDIDISLIRFKPLEKWEQDIADGNYAEVSSV